MKEIPLPKDKLDGRVLPTSPLVLRRASVASRAVLYSWRGRLGEKLRRIITANIMPQNGQTPKLPGQS